MIPFQPPSLSDKIWVDPLLARGGDYGGEFNFTILYTWAGAYGQELALWDGFLTVRLKRGGLGLCYLWPVGEGDRTAVLGDLERDAAALGQPLRLVCLTAAQAAALEALFPGKFDFQRDRGGDDYIYELDRIADLSGKKLHPKRTHVNRFMEAYPHWSCEAITPCNLAECLAMDEAWHLRRHGDTGGSLQAEGAALRLALRDFSALGLDGLLLRAEEDVVAFAIGDLFSRDCYSVHFEKAFGEIQGAYPMIAQQFARYVRRNYPDVRLLNREDDMNVEGLRRAKLSFGPDRMLEKHIAVAK